MHSLIGFQQVNLRIAVCAAGVAAIVAGCCTSRETHTARYSRPAYVGGTAEYQTRAPAPQATATVSSESTNLVLPLYQESVNVGKREVESGSVRVKKIVRTETVNVPVELRHEEVVIDRDRNARADQSQAFGQPFQEQETVIPLKREEAVIEKQTTPAGEIVVQKRFAGGRTNIQAQVRREDVDIAKQGDAQNVIIGENVHARAESSGAAESAGGQAYGAGASATVITDPAMLSSSGNLVTMAGRPVRFSGIKAQRIVGDRLIVLTPENGREIYVVPAQSVSLPKAGQTVMITGTIKKSPSSSSELGLTGDAAQTLSSQPVYIEAQKIEVVR